MLIVVLNGGLGYWPIEILLFYFLAFNFVNVFLENIGVSMMIVFVASEFWEIPIHVIDLFNGFSNPFWIYVMASSYVLVYMTKMKWSTRLRSIITIGMICTWIPVFMIIGTYGLPHRLLLSYVSRAMSVAMWGLMVKYARS